MLSAQATQRVVRAKATCWCPGLRLPRTSRPQHGCVVGSRSRVAVVPQASSDRDQADRDRGVQMRAEAEAPFRGLRLVLLGFFAASAGMGFLISVPQLIGALGGARSALPLDQVLQNMAIDAGAVGVFAFLFYRDWQINRLKREEGLGALPIRLASGKTLRLEDLRGSARVVVAAGTPEQVSQALQEAEPLREELIRRGVIVVPLPLFKGEGEGEAAALPPLTSADQRWRVEPLRLQQWEEWFAEQLAFSPKAKQERGLFVGLRLDGRVRSSGSGSPPWRRYALELAPLEGEGKWTGFMDGFDGRV